MELPSPVVPMIKIPFTPAAIRNSKRRFVDNRSNLPSAVIGVIMGTTTPEFFDTFLINMLSRKSPWHHFLSVAEGCFLKAALLASRLWPCREWPLAGFPDRKVFAAHRNCGTVLPEIQRRLRRWKGPSLFLAGQMSAISPRNGPGLRGS